MEIYKLSDHKQVKGKQAFNKSGGHDGYFFVVYVLLYVVFNKYNYVPSSVLSAICTNRTYHFWISQLHFIERLLFSKNSAKSIRVLILVLLAEKNDMPKAIKTWCDECYNGGIHKGLWGQRAGDEVTPEGRVRAPENSHHSWCEDPKLAGCLGLGQRGPSDLVLILCSRKSLRVTVGSPSSHDTFAASKMTSMLAFQSGTGSLPSRNEKKSFLGRRKNIVSKYRVEGWQKMKVDKWTGNS